MNKINLNHIAKFIVVGAISTAINYACFYLLTKFSLTTYLLASVIGYIIGLTAGYFLNNFWTFQSSGYQVNKIIIYCCVYLFSLGLSTFFLWVAVNKFQLNKYIMNVGAIGISTITNFVGLKLLDRKSVV